VVWCGSNEIETGIGGPTGSASWWGTNTSANPWLYASDFYATFLAQLLPLVRGELGPGVVYRPSSPTNTLLSIDPPQQLWMDASNKKWGDPPLLVLRPLSQEVG
jgi:hypothetical protein